MHDNIRNITPDDFFEAYQVCPEPVFNGGSIEDLEDIIENGYY